MMGKMTKAEIAAQMGISPQALAASEASKKAEIQAGFRREVDARTQAAAAPDPTAAPSWQTKAQGSLTEIHRAAASAVEVVTGTISSVREAGAEFEDARKRNATPDSNENRRTQRALEQAEGTAPAVAAPPLPGPSR